MRICACCAQSENLAGIDSAIRAHESFASIAARYNVSSDSVSRHARNHLNAKSAADTDLAARYRECYERADSLYRQAVAKGSDRAAIDSLVNIVTILDKLSKLQATSPSGFDALDLAGKVARIRADRKLMLGIFDSLVADRGITWDQHLTECENSVRSIHEPDNHD